MIGVYFLADYLDVCKMIRCLVPPEHGVMFLVPRDKIAGCFEFYAESEACSDNYHFLGPFMCHMEYISILDC